MQTYVTCPVCGEISESLVTRFSDRSGKAVHATIAGELEGWTPADGCCHRCFTACDNPRSTSRMVKRHGPFAVLPVPMRTNADPRFTGRGVTIAFIDSGFFPHPELGRMGRRLLTMVDVTADREGASYFRLPHHESWHGTMSAVIASGSGSLSEGYYRGIAPDASLVCIKTFNRKAAALKEPEIRRAIRWVIENRKRYNIRILNISVGGDSPKTLKESPVDQLVEEAFDQGILTVVAVGNTPGRPIVPPASAPSGLCVGGYDDRNELERGAWTMYPTTFGVTVNGHRKPDILGPAGALAGPLLPGTDQADEAMLLFRILSARPSEGMRILRERHDLLRKEAGRVTARRIRSWVMDRITEAKYISQYHKKMEGTSVAAAVVSSVAAQMLEANPLLTAAELRLLLTKTARLHPALPPEAQGSGLLNPRAAVARALLALHPELSPGIRFHNDHLVFLYEGEAGSVHLAGEFNGWNPATVSFHHLGDNRWSCLIPRPENGSDRYKLVVDGTRWIHDPNNERKEPDGFGGWNSRFPETAN